MGMACDLNNFLLQANALGRRTFHAHHYSGSNIACPRVIHFQCLVLGTQLTKTHLGEGVVVEDIHVVHHAPPGVKLARLAGLVQMKCLTALYTAHAAIHQLLPPVLRAVLCKLRLDEKGVASIEAIPVQSPVDFAKRAGGHRIQDGFASLATASLANQAAEGSVVADISTRAQEDLSAPGDGLDLRLHILRPTLNPARRELEGWDCSAPPI